MKSPVQVDVSGLVFSAEVPVDTAIVKVTALTRAGREIKSHEVEIEDSYELEGHLRDVLSDWAAENPNGGIVTIEFTAIDVDRQPSLPARVEVVISQPMIAGLLPSRKVSAKV